MIAHPVERLSAFLDGELAAAERSAVEAHLRECPSCARHLEELAAVDALAREVAVEAPPGYFDTLPARVRARLSARRRLAPFALWSGLAAAAAVVLAAVIVPITLTRQRSILPSAAEAPAVVPEPATTVAPATAVPPAAAPVARSAEAETQLADRAQATPGVDRSLPREDAMARRRVPARLRERDEAPAALKAVATPAPVAATSTPPPAPTPAPSPAAAPVDTAAAAPSLEARDERLAPAGKTAEGAVVTAASEPAAKEEQARAAPAQAGRRAGAAATFGQARPDVAGEVRFRILVARTAATAAEARALREAWATFAAEHPSDARADEARVRAIESGLQAWRLGGDPADLEAARAAALAYLASPAAPQAERVRRTLAVLPSPAAP